MIVLVGTGGLLTMLAESGSGTLAGVGKFLALSSDVMKNRLNLGMVLWKDNFGQNTFGG